jgi:hypothetical protein
MPAMDASSCSVAGSRQLLRNQQFRDFELFVDALGLSKRGEISREHELPRPRAKQQPAIDRFRLSTKARWQRANELLEVFVLPHDGSVLKLLREDGANPAAIVWRRIRDYERFQCCSAGES